MTTLKKIIGGIAEGVGEVIKEGAKEIAETVDPTKLIESAIGPKKTGNEFTEYLKGISGNLSSEDLETKRKEFEKKEAIEKAEAEKVIREALPAHLKPTQTSREPSVYERNIREEEMKNAQAIEAQKKQPKTISAPAGKVTGVLGGKRRPKSADFEAKHDAKVG